jgi:cation diffusion facilitator CzcD-associated flavoprotein CzcO
MSVGIIGAGVSGMAAGLSMQRRGVPFTIFEKADEVGGTWRENRYPGLTIDVPSPIYTFSGQRNPRWGRLLPKQAEILAYHRDVSFRSGLRERIRFGCEITSATWTGTEWELRAADGACERVRALICATGFLHHPHIPEIDGLATFAGECVHSARWRDDIELAGRRVGVIGTGSTGIQLVAATAGVASHVTHFQRTPQWIFPVVNAGIPRPLQALLARRPGLLEAIIDGTELIADWLLGGASSRPNLRRRMIESVARLHLATVRDPALRRTLTPKDSALCKRPVVSSRFYRAVQRPDVSVIDAPITGVEPRGVRTADGTLHELDVLVLATGFRAHDYMRPIAITGEDGLTLDEAWANGPHGYRTVTLTGFPNLFMVMGPHSPLLSFPIHTSAELQSEYAAQLIELIARDDLVAVSPTPAATKRWLQEITAGMPGTVWASGCTSWYLGAGDVPVLWPYDRRRWRETLRAPVLDDYAIRAAVVERAV